MRPSPPISASRMRRPDRPRGRRWELAARGSVEARRGCVENDVLAIRRRPGPALVWRCVLGGGLVALEPVAAVDAADERGWDLDAAGDAVAGGDDGDGVGAHDPAEVSS